MLDNVVSCLVTKVLNHLYDGDESKIPVLDYLGTILSFVSLIPGVGVFQPDNEVKLTIPAAVPAHGGSFLALS
jgi:hypothetical protein